MGLSSFLNLAAALSVLLVPMAGMLAFFIWVAVVTAREEEKEE